MLRMGMQSNAVPSGTIHCQERLLQKEKAKRRVLELILYLKSHGKTRQQKTFRAHIQVPISI